MRFIGIWLMVLLMVIYGRPEYQVVEEYEETTVNEHDLPHDGVRHLDLSSRNIFIIKMVVKYYFKLLDLWTLSFANNSIFYIDEQLFHPLVSLQKLDLHSNWIDNLYPNTFEFSQNLIELDLSYNRFRSISLKVLSPLKSLEVLNLCGNPLVHIWKWTEYAKEPTAVLENLKSLFVCNTTIKIIRPSEVGILRQLERLDITNNRYLMCEATFFETIKILEQDKVQLIEVDFKKSVSVVTFDTYGNASDYDFTVDRFVPIVYGNPEELLTRVCISHVVLDTTDKMLRLVNGIDLINNQIASVACEVFDELHQLYYLDLSRNLLRELSGDCFEKLLRLRALNISNNFLNDIEPGTFKNNANLRILDISRNKLKGLSNQLFEPLEHLLELRLEDNQLTHIWTTPHNNFLRRMRLLSISNNQFISFRTDDYEMLEKFQYMEIANNPLHCDDNFLEFIQFCIEENIQLDVGFDYCMKPIEDDAPTIIEQDAILGVVRNGAAPVVDDSTIILIFIIIMSLFVIYKSYF